jgi:hypothetical protein
MKDLIEAMKEVVGFAREIKGNTAKSGGISLRLIGNTKIQAPE